MKFEDKLNDILESVVLEHISPPMETVTLPDGTKERRLVNLKRLDWFHDVDRFPKYLVKTDTDSFKIYPDTQEVNVNTDKRKRIPIEIHREWMYLKHRKSGDIICFAYYKHQGSFHFADLRADEEVSREYIVSEIMRMLGMDEHDASEYVWEMLQGGMY